MQTQFNTESTAKSIENTALLVIDLQKDFLQTSGKLPVDLAQVPQLIDTANQAIQDFQANGKLVLHIINAFRKRDIGNLFRKFAAIEGSEGASIDPRVQQEEIPCITKWKGDAFCNPLLLRTLRKNGITHLILVGVYTDGCVKATAKSALQNGFQVSILEKGVASRSLKASQRGLKACQKMGAQVL